MQSPFKVCLLIGALLATLHYSGSRKILLEDRILNGLMGYIRNMPWMVAIYQVPHYNTIATGGIIGPTWVLTAGHVFLDPNLDNQETTFIKYGATFSNQSEGGSATIRDIYIHPNYTKENTNAKEYDVCLLNMTEAFPFRPGYVMPKKIFRTDEVLRPGTVCLVAGYGTTATDADKVFAKRLFFLPVAILENKVCNDTFEEFFEYQVCAGMPRTDSGLCAGDSGAPLVCRGMVYAVHVGGAQCRQGLRKIVNTYVPLWNVRDFINQYLPDTEVETTTTVEATT